MVSVSFNSKLLNLSINMSSAVMTGHPFDLVKVRLQTGIFTSSVQCVRETVARDGLRGMYRGVLPPLLGVTPMFAVSFWGYDVGKRVVNYFTGTEVKNFTIKNISTAGMLLAVPTTLVAAPFERVKVMMQVQTGKLTSMGSVVKEMYRTGGFRLIFKGLVATFARDGPGLALYFSTYEVVKEGLSTPGKEMSLMAIMVAGGCAGVSMWLGVFPIDTIKLKQQLSNVQISIVETTRTIYRSGGIKAFFPGVGPALARSFPANSATFLGVEIARNLMDSIYRSLQPI